MTVLTLAEAEALADRTLAAIDDWAESGLRRQERAAADQERVASDLAGLRQHARAPWWDPEFSDPDDPIPCGACTFDIRRVTWPCDDARRYSDGLRRTATLYGAEGTA